ncbi:MAG TPA: crossover junction endodeoxyribonuclease RuvC [Candidatus Baltobacteraceae bacterium]|nr:crossover junction endodeoxyribonuclease RuvC [Candidatus Baltobacteraceae bacterium]
MIILGIDPGTARVGFGLLRKEGSKFFHVAHGCLETPKTMAHADRLHSLHVALGELIDLHKPELVGVEKLFFQKNVKTAMAVSEARGVTLLSLRDRGVPISEHTPMQVKMAITGYGGADKRQVQEMVRLLFKLKEIPKPDDAADALAIAYCAAVSAPPM